MRERDCCWSEFTISVILTKAPLSKRSEEWKYSWGEESRFQKTETLDTAYLRMRGKSVKLSGLKIARSESFVVTEY
jgi:hypothetical protein